MLATVAAISMQGASQIQPANSMRSDRGIEVFTDAGRGVVTLREFEVNLRYPSGKSGRGAFLLVFDPVFGYFTEYFDSGSKTDYRLADRFVLGSRIYAAPDRLVVFSFVLRSLKVSSSNKRASSLKEAEARALDDAGALLGEREAPLKKRAPVTLDVGFPDGFDLPPGTAAPWGRVEILSIARGDKTWELILEGRWKAKLRLDENFTQFCAGCGFARLR
jgi:hypothetical protein